MLGHALQRPRRIAICILLVALCACPVPIPAQAAGKTPACDVLATTPQLCKVSYPDTSPILVVEGVGFTPKAAVRVEIADSGTQTHNTLNLKASPEGIIEATVLNECLLVAGQAVAIDTATGRKSPPLVVPVQPSCMSLLEARLSAGQSGLNTPIFSHPTTCDLEATTPSICGTNFNGTSTADGTLDIYGTGFTASKVVHVRVKGSDFSSVSFDATADGHGLLFATTPHTLPCYTSSITVTAIDAASDAQISQPEDAVCTYVQSSSGGGGGGWHVTIVPIGLIIAVVSGLIRRSRRRNA